MGTILPLHHSGIRVHGGSPINVPRGAKALPAVETRGKLRGTHGHGLKSRTPSEHPNPTTKIGAAHRLSGWPKKSPNFIFTTKMVFPKSLKFMNSGSEAKMGGEFTYQSKWDPKTVLTTATSRGRRGAANSCQASSGRPWRVRWTQSTQYPASGASVFFLGGRVVDCPTKTPSVECRAWGLDGPLLWHMRDRM